MDSEISLSLKELLFIVARLHQKYPHKHFTLDGRLVGDIGEIIVASEYNVELLEGMQKHHDAKTSDHRMVQIKATMKDLLTFPANHIPQYYLGIKIMHDGTFEEIFNGPGEIAANSIKGRAVPATNLHSVSIRKLSELNKTVSEKERIPRRMNEL